MQGNLLGVPNVFNFRDFGGLPCSDGRVVRRGMLYRSGQLYSLEADQIADLRSRNFKLVADLRHPAERMNAPSFWNSDEQTRVKAHENQTGKSAPHEALLSSGLHSIAEVDLRFKKFYRDLPYDTEYRPLFAEVLRGIAEGNLPVLIHCSAGKDRTGFLVGLILSVLGVPVGLILSDYLKSKEALKSGPLKASLEKKFFSTLSASADPRLLNRVLGVEEKYLIEAFTSIDENSGSLSEYLDDGGVDLQCRSSMREKLTSLA